MIALNIVESVDLNYDDSYLIEKVKNQEFQILNHEFDRIF
jgi:hypothetical protein